MTQVLAKVKMGLINRLPIKALADSCSEEDVVLDYCRVKEINEDNNESESLLVKLPSLFELPKVGFKKSE